MKLTSAFEDPLAKMPGRRMVAVLAVTQTIGYGVLYYAFSVLITPMSQDLDAEVAHLTGALTLSVLISGLMAPLVGRLLDSHGGRGVMTMGALLGGVAVLAWSQVNSLVQLYFVFVLVGVASAMVLYESAFAVIVDWYDAKRRSEALLAVTIVAGFASSIFLPLTGFLVDRYGWRSTLMVLGLGYLAIAMPLHGLTLRRHPKSRRTQPTICIRTTLHERVFWLLALAFLAQTGAVGVIGVLLVTYLIELGHSLVFAATVAGLLGVLSVTGRIVTTGLHKRWPVAVVTAAVFVVQGLAAGALPLVGRSPGGAIVAVILFGFGFGVATIARPALLMERYGTAAYASLSGALALPIFVSKGIAPLLAAWMGLAVGTTALMAAVAIACLVGALALVTYQRA